MKKLLSLILLCPTLALALTLEELSDRLRAHPVVHGNFVQEKQLRALAQPIISGGTFVLSQQRGLLWYLERPIEQRYRIDESGVMRWRDDAWQPAGQSGALQQRLFLAALSGDVAALQRDFAIQLQQTTEGWQATLTPRGALLKQIFERIELVGDSVMKRIELREQSGDATVIRLQAKPAAALSPQEQANFAH